MFEPHMMPGPPAATWLNLRIIVPNKKTPERPPAVRSYQSGSPDSSGELHHPRKRIL